MSDGGLVLADGTVIYKDGSIIPPHVDEVVDEQPVNEEPDVTQLVIPQPKKIRSLPDTPRTMNVLCAVLCYSLFGLEDDAIGEALGTDASRVEGLRKLPAYHTLHKDVVTNIINAEQADVRELFVKHARTAVHTVVEGMTAKRTSDRLRAAGDILDRSGFRPVDVVEHRHRLDGGLTIEVVRKDAVLPVIDIDVMEN